MLRPLLFATTSWPLLLSAQAVLNRHALPQAGTRYGYHEVDFRPSGRAGDGQTWDLSAMPDGDLVPYAWSTSELRPGAGVFPAHAEVLDVPGQPLQYFDARDTGVVWLGWYSDTGLVRFDPPIRLLHLPCSFNDAWTDSGTAVVTGQGRILTLRYAFHAQADGRGALNLPYGMEDEVLRLRSELHLFKAEPPRTRLATEIRTSWYSDACPVPLMIAEERPQADVTRRTMAWLDGSWRDGPERLFRPMALRVFPDPCDDQVWIVLPARDADHTVVQLVDEGGNVAKLWNLEFTSPITRTDPYDVSDVPAGSYMVNWVGRNGTIGTARLEVQH